MLNVQKKQIKTIQDYRHSIKLLKYHLKKQKKTNDKLKYQSTKSKYRPKAKATLADHNRVYQLSQTVRIVAERLKRIGLVLEDVFRMADSRYEGEITKEQFMRVVGKLKTNLGDNVFMEMFHAIDTSMNYLISEDQFQEFSIAYGGCTDPKLIRKFQNKCKTKLLTLIKKNHKSVQNFLQPLPEPIPVDLLSSLFRKLQLSNNQCMILLKTFDPSHEGFTNHKFFLSVMGDVKEKTQKQQQNEELTKNVNQFCVVIRDRKINPIALFQEADVDGKEGVSPFQLEQAFRKIMPDQTTFQIKKWINLINSNNDSQITKQQFINSIRGMYSITQITKFSQQYLKSHPELKIPQDSQAPEKIIKQLSNILEDKGMKKKQAFDFIDFNKSGDIDKKELMEGLAGLGVKVGVIGRVLALFDRNGSETVDYDEWCRIMGEDVQMSQVGNGEEINLDSQSQQQEQKKNKKQTKKPQIKTKQSDPKGNIKQNKQNQKNNQKQKVKLTNIKDKKQQTKHSSQTKTPRKDEKVNSSKLQKKQTGKSDKINEKTSVQKPDLKKTQTLEQKSKINDKKFAEDQIQQKNPQIKTSKIDKINDKKIDKKQSKDDKKNLKQTDSKIKKKQSKAPQTKPTPDLAKKKSSALNIRKTQSVIQKQPQNQSAQQAAQQPNLDNLQQQIAIAYKKNKSKFLKQFQQFDKKNKGVINKNNFSTVIKKISKGISEGDALAIFQKYVSSDSCVHYEEWLEGIADTWAEEVEEEKDPEQEQADILQQDEEHEEQKHEQDHNDHQYDQQFEQEQEQQKQNKKIQQSKKIKQTKKPIKQNQKQKQKQKQKDPEDTKKRGEDLPQFQKLITQIIIPQQGKVVNSGYKLIDYISDQQNQLKKCRQQLLAKSKQIKQKSQLYQDPEFPPNKSSLSPSQSNQIKFLQLIQWQHYKKFMKKPTLFHGQIEPNDIKQGGLGNCYFLSSLACLAQYSNLIERLFEYYDIDNGYFLIWLCIDGSWRLVEVDGYLPCRKNYDGSYRIAFSRAENDELWVSLLEKAYAKSYGSYENIVGGQPIEAIRDLSGAPGNMFTFDNQKVRLKRIKLKNQKGQQFPKGCSMDQIWQKLFDAENKQYIMAAGTQMKEMGTKIQGHQQDVTTQGIVLGHAYSILDCKQIDRQRIIKMRNPWGEIEWTASDWADRGKKWTEALKKKLNYKVDQKDGIFWIQLPRFFQNFSTCSVNYIRPNYYFRSDKIPKQRQFLVTITGKFNVGYLMINHKDHRHTKAKDQPYDGVYRLLGFICKDGKVLKKYDQKYYLYQREGCVQFNEMNSFPEGSQAMMLVTLFKTTDVVVGYYGDKYSDFTVDPNCLPYVQKLAYRQQNIQKANIDQERGVKVWQQRIHDMIFFCFKNITSAPITITQQLEPKPADSIKPIPPYGMQNTLKINPDEIQSAKYKVIKDYQTYSYGYNRK